MPGPNEYKDERVFMNTRIAITLVSDQGTIPARNAIEQAYKQFDSVVKRFTRFDDSSELSKLNRSTGKPQVVSQDMFDLIERMVKVADLTNGAFDPTIIDLLELYGFSKDQDYDRLSNPTLLKEIKNYVAGRPSVNEIKLNKDLNTVRLHKRQRIDLGSIGKGYAIDLAADKLQGHTGFLISAGGDLRAEGKKADGSDWKLGVVKLSLPNKELTDPDILGHISSPIALAGSGGWVRRVAWFHHLLNPTNGLPHNEVSQSYVQSPTATDADLWSTALFVTGTKGLEILKKQDNLEGLIINANGDIHKTEGFSLQ